MTRSVLLEVIERLGRVKVVGIALELDHAVLLIHLGKDLVVLDHLENALLNLGSALELNLE